MREGPVARMILALILPEGFGSRTLLYLCSPRSDTQSYHP